MKNDSFGDPNEKCMGKFSQDLFGQRMKRYEAVPELYLMRRTPVIIRIDGKAFHTLTRDMDKPYDERFRRCMEATAAKLVNSIQGCKFAYVQSDEISLLLTDFETLETEPWFGYRVQKMVSVAASIATNTFVEQYRISIAYHKYTEIAFDARCFNISREEAANYFIWRQNDAFRNAVRNFGTYVYGHKQMQGVGTKEALDKLATNEPWNYLNNMFKWGFIVDRKGVRCFTFRSAREEVENYFLEKTDQDENGL